MENYAILQLENEIIRFKNHRFAYEYVKDAKKAIDKLINGTQVEINKEVISYLVELSRRIDNGVKEANEPLEYWVKRQNKRLSQVDTAIVKLIETKKSINICGFWFHITFRKDSGIDQMGNGWYDFKNPTPVNQSLIDNCLDKYNKIIST